MVQIKEKNGDTFGEKEFVVMKDNIEELRRRIFEEAERDPDQFHPADVQKIADCDELCRRFIRQKKLNLDAAFEMTKNALIWRKKFEVNDITEATLPPVYFDFGAMFPLGQDKYGSQLIYHRVKLHRKDERQAIQHRRFLVFWVEKLLYELDHVRLSFILDLGESGYGNMDMELIGFLISLFKEYYPWALGYIMVYDMPWLFNTAWKVIKSWVPAEGVERVKFVDRNTITNYVSPENLPDYMGGTVKLPFREYTWDDVDFIVNHASVEVQPADVEPCLSRASLAQVIRERIPRTPAIEEFYRSRFGMFTVRSSADTDDHAALIKVEPDTDLVFGAEEPDLNKHAGSLVLTNTSDSHVAFKIKTNNIDGYKVKPFFGIIPLNSTVSVNVAQNPGSEFHASDKLLIMTTGIETLEISPRELIDHWRSVAKDNIKEHRLRCVNVSSMASQKPTSEMKELTSRSGTTGPRQPSLGKEKSYQSFCPPKPSSPGTSSQLEIIQDVVGDVQSKLGDVYQEMSAISRRQDQFGYVLLATMVLVGANLLMLIVVKNCQSATEWYC
ncbi:motile sperm domain-containing protein 2-like isoform X1 [Dermacentor andersoni]|uniref:motile sperm domain-containing protein 2-like isoform X1 n=1 Tax=Dermacentor andersoni TaxID=34620 RepID=UPI002155AABF|nr:motile sperm domain-containing protein 2-like isoform X1 [Dermacentor andersoni]